MRIQNGAQYMFDNGKYGNFWVLFFIDKLKIENNNLAG
jgi:hypothetical protein